MLKYTLEYTNHYNNPKTKIHMSCLKPNDANGVRVAYQISEPEQYYYPEKSFYHIRISWNEYQSYRAKLKRMLRLGRIETFFPESQITFFTLENGVAGFNDKFKFIAIQANNKKRANLCARELGLPVLRR